MPRSTHGLSKTRTYNIWAMMWQRCTNPKAANYVSYGGAGVVVHPAWRDFGRFLDDMGHPPTETHTLDRINNTMGYTPENCRWADVETQQNNRAYVRKITAFGLTLGVNQWARKTGLTSAQIAHRVFVMNLSPEEALRWPRMSHNKRAIRRSQLDGSDVRVFASLADAAKSLSTTNYETTKKGLWAALQRARGVAIWSGYSWAYDTLETPVSSSTYPESL